MKERLHRIEEEQNLEVCLTYSYFRIADLEKPQQWQKKSRKIAEAQNNIETDLCHKCIFATDFFSYN